MAPINQPSVATASTGRVDVALPAVGAGGVVGVVGILGDPSLDKARLIRALSGRNPAFHAPAVDADPAPGFTQGEELRDFVEQAVSEGSGGVVVAERAVDLAPVRDQLVALFVLRIEDRRGARDALRLLDVPPNGPRMMALQMLDEDHCVYRDGSGRSRVVRVDQIHKVVSVAA